MCCHSNANGWHFEVFTFSLFVCVLTMNMCHTANPLTNRTCDGCGKGASTSKRNKIGSENVAHFFGSMGNC